MKFQFENHNGKKVNLSEYPYIFQSGDLIDYTWSYDKENSFKNPKKKPKNFTVKIAVMEDFQIPIGERKEKFKQDVDYLVGVLEEDVLDETEGKLYTDTGYYMSCICTASKKSDWNMGQPIMFNSLTISSLNPFWIKETPYSFEAKALSLSNVKKYAYKYPYRYSISAGENFIENSHYADCNFKLRIYGPCVNPHIIIGTHRYQVWTILTAGEWLEIDSIHNKVYKVMINGTKVSLFNERDKLSSVFEKIPPGRQRVAAPGTFNFDLVLYEERSEPEWV